MADSTSRWAEAMREISSRLEEMPGEEGYPTYLATKLAAFYERSGRTVCLGKSENQEDLVGSVTIVGAVSPPGGDFSEPVTQSTLRIVGTFWALDDKLANRRHFPAINWARSYSLYHEHLGDWYRDKVSPEFVQLTRRMSALLQREAELQEIVQLVGPDALQDAERLIIEVGKILREDFLQQNAFSDIDGFCPMEKQYGVLRGILEFYDRAQAALKIGKHIEQILESPAIEQIARFKEVPHKDFPAALDVALQSAAAL